MYVCMYVYVIGVSVQSPALVTAESKEQFVRRLLPPNQEHEHVTAEMNITKAVADILAQLGNG